MEAAGCGSGFGLAVLPAWGFSAVLPSAEGSGFAKGEVEGISAEMGERKKKEEGEDVLVHHSPRGEEGKRGGKLRLRLSKRRFQVFGRMENST